MSSDFPNKLSSIDNQKAAKSTQPLAIFRNKLPVLNFSPSFKQMILNKNEGFSQSSQNRLEEMLPSLKKSTTSVKLPPMTLEIRKSQIIEPKSVITIRNGLYPLENSSHSVEPELPITPNNFNMLGQKKTTQNKEKNINEYFRRLGSMVMEQPLDPINTISEDKIKSNNEEFKALESMMMEQPLGLVSKKRPKNISPDTETQRGSIIMEEDPSKSLENSSLRKQSTIKLDRIPNVITRCGFKTHVGSVMGKKKKHNQDSWLILQKIQDIKGQYLFAVCDGHGNKGHKVSNIIKNRLPVSFTETLNEYENSSMKSLEEIASISINKTVDFTETSDFNLNFSGSTLVTVFIKGKELVCGNIGDSRAVIGNKDKNNKWQAIELSSDHKPSRQDEAVRVSMAGGIIRQFQSVTGEHGGPLRVWSKDKSVPGLAMTRSIGDLISKKNGIISEPEIKHRNLTKYDKFLILASDGIWEFITSQEAVNIVKDIWAQGKSEACCEKLLEIATERWEKENIIDDITVLVAFINVR
jgi:serine/threonine protein phosphatase PrpC